MEKYQRKPKTIVTMTLDLDVITEIRLRRINLSALINDFLKEYIGKPEESVPREKDDIIQEIAISKNRIRNLEDKKESIEKEQKRKEEEEKKNRRSPIQAY